jgi:hypothetical protein
VRASRAAKPVIAEEKKLAPQKNNKEKLRERERERILARSGA